MNNVNPKKLLNSKWTKIQVKNGEKHFIMVKVSYGERQDVEYCQLEAVINHQLYSIDWRELKDPQQWRMGWI